MVIGTAARASRAGWFVRARASPSAQSTSRSGLSLNRCQWHRRLLSTTTTTTAKDTTRTITDQGPSTQTAKTMPSTQRAGPAILDPDLLYPIGPPVLAAAWRAHEKAHDLPFPPRADPPTPAEDREQYRAAALARNAELLAGRDSYLKEGLRIHDTAVEVTREYSIPVRSYMPAAPAGEEGAFEEIDRPIVVYYHGGGLVVGDLDCEDLSCRRISLALGCTVYSVDYRLMPAVTADEAVSDALAAFRALTSLRKSSKWLIMGSSSGGQLAATVAQNYRPTLILHRARKMTIVGPQIHGVLLRGPVTCDATGEAGSSVPERFRQLHHSISPAFHTSLLAGPAVEANNRVTRYGMPLEAEAETLARQPRHWIQVTTNDIYYSDGLCYARALVEAGVETRLDVWEGWPHTFWIKAPLLDEALQAEMNMLEGVRWLIEREAPPGYSLTKELEPQAGGFVPMSDDEFEKKFMNVE